MRFVLASHNKGKLAEMQAILGELGVEVVMPSDVGVDVDVEETGTTFAENAALKANAIMAASGLPAIADDSGLCVDWLQGAPGIYSARYGGLDSDPERCRLLLGNMRGATNRAAHFHTELPEDLVKDRHDLYDQYKEYGGKHAKHDQRISQGVPDTAAQIFLPLIMNGKGSKGIVQISGKLPHFYHMDEIRGKNCCFFQSRLDIPAFQQLLVNDGEDSFSVLGICILLQDGNSLQK